MMALRRAHGTGKSAMVRIEPRPADELPAGVAGPPRPVAPRDSAGRFVPGDGTRALARTGGQARAESVALARLMGLSDLPEGHPFLPYARLAREWRDDEMLAIAQRVGGGVVSAGVASIISSAALQLAASRYAYDRGTLTGDLDALSSASRFADASRQNTLAARELAAREAHARRPERKVPWAAPTTTTATPPTTPRGEE